ncbi:N-acetylglucosamine kinase [Bizionia saleffrena]|uniref:N-acetylglucosamine kinase n=1 Tax=Bizionia saleffrena TaxID=291189 RepID=A0A8H2LDK7_9FLAO|nr:N-acetylglucosamine kinase [Bizionia saleffrena]TYB76608.1 N-acetylglucosamine kinase [Bizionia saleffrena]
MILIADSGSTKCDWIAVDKTGVLPVQKIRTKGLNPAILNAENLQGILNNSEALKALQRTVTEIYFYGAGCGTAIPKALLKAVLEAVYIKATVSVNEDTMAAVYATITTKNEAGIVCILGTGSNCSFFDGNSVHQKIASLGYTLMDDASGNYYGKQLLRDYYFNSMPEELKEVFKNTYDITPDTIKFNLYKQPNPNAYLADFAEFMVNNKSTDYCNNLIIKGMRLFAETMVLQYKEELKIYPVHFAGSLAYYCQDEIQIVAKEFGFKTGRFVKRPIEGLVAYHTKK